MAPLETRFDEYRLIRLLGRGATGEVHLAHDELLDRAVALKVLATRTGPSARAHLIEEARAAARLSHPNVVTIYRVGERDGQAFIATELIRGTSLDALTKPVPWRRVLDIGIGLARGLGAAHRHGVLHRDVKPANAMLTEEGEVKLVDFGLATPAATSRPSEVAAIPFTPDDAAALPLGTMSFVPPDLAGEVSHVGRRPAGGSASRVGTPLYMAPEVWRGEVGTRRSDVYSLGALLYELLGGAPPHAATSILEVMTAATSLDARPLGEIAPDVDARLAGVVHRCLARDPAGRFASAEELRDALEHLLPQRAAATPEGNPYRGLSSFDAEHAALFFGRDREARAVVERLRGDAFVLVAGDSGVGKSSLVRAGVLPLVAAGALGGERVWEVVTFAPGRRPVAALSAVLAETLGLDESALAERITSDPAGAARAVRGALGKPSRRARPVEDGAGRGERGLIVYADALEELLTLSEPDEATQVAEVVRELALVGTAVRILATVRGDFVTRLARMPRFGDDLARALYILRPLDDDGLRAAIVEPARAKGVRFEPPELVDTLAAAARADGALPLLQFALAELWEARDREASAITAAALHTVGGVDGALERHADGVLEGLLPSPRAAARRVLVRLVTPEGTRARRTSNELTGDEADARAALEALVRGRLVVAREAPGGSVYELAHEALIAVWGTLRAWLASDVDQRALAERARAATKEWERLGRARDALWGERQLVEAARLDRGALAPTERAFVAASTAAARRRRAARLALVLAVPAVVGATWGGLRLDAARTLARRVDAALSPARTHVVTARHARGEADRLANEAYARFDRHERAAGEEAWTGALKSRAEATRAFTDAARAAETALLLDGARTDARALLGDVIYERALAADADGDDGAAAELLGRLSLYDADGTRRRRWNAPARLTVDASPEGAAIQVERWDEPEGGRGRWLTVGPSRSVPVTLEVERGSYRVRASREGRLPVLATAVLSRGEALPLHVTLPRPGTVPAGFVYIPAGRFLTGAREDERQRKDFLKAAPLHPFTTRAFLIQATEATYQDWIAWLETLPADERQRRLPRATSVGVQGDVALRQVQGTWELRLQPAGAPLSAHAGAMIRYPARAKNAEMDWLRMPVSGVSFRDVEAYVAWLATSGRVPGARLCREEEWEHAARGADGRVYPHGQHLEPEDVNGSETYGPNAEAHGPDQVGLHAASDSPFGVHDLAGNVFEMVRTEGEAAGVEVVRGGSFPFDANAARTELREHIEPELRDITIGFRVCAEVPPNG